MIKQRAYSNSPHRYSHCSRELADTTPAESQVLVATAEMAWGMTLAAQLVVIMGTQYFDGTGAGGTDYPVTDLLQVRLPRDEQHSCPSCTSSASGVRGPSACPGL